jgi:uncharacterized protein YbjT (DUF2867 family)
VSSLVRDARQAADVEAVGATPLVADVEHLDASGIAAQLSGHDAVVWSAGAGGGDKDRTYAVDRDAAVRSMDAASSAGVERYVMISYFGAGRDHGVSPDSGFYAYAEAKGAADEHLQITDLAWTILRPSALTSEPGTGRIEMGTGIKGSSVARADVAAVLVAVLEEPGAAGKIFEFNAGKTPISAAIAGSQRR